MGGDPRVEEALASGFVPPEITAAQLEANQDLTGIVSIVLVTALASVVVVFRLLSRRFIIKRFGFGLDDALALVSLIVFIPMAALCIELILLGGAREGIFFEWVLPVQIYQKIQVVDSVEHLVYSTALLLCRMSGLAFYYRICALHKEFLVAIRVIFAVLIVGYLVQTLLIIFHCKPVNLAWVPFSEDGTLLLGSEFSCLPWWEVHITVSAISLACDLLLFGLPVAMLQMLEMPRKQKVQLACILLPGIAVVGISITRVALVILYRDDLQESKYSFLKLLIVEVSEVSATLIALSIPGVKPMVDRFILRKDNCSETGGSRTSSHRGSIGSQNSGLSAIKGRSHLSVLDMESTAQYGAAVWQGEQTKDTKQEGIHVTVDVYVEDGQSKPGYEKLTFR